VDAVEQWLNEIRAVIKDDQDIDLRRHGFLPDKQR
jgi:hypothetical protein